MPGFRKLIYKLSASPIRIPAEVFKELDKSILNIY